MLVRWQAIERRYYRCTKGADTAAEFAVLTSAMVADLLDIDHARVRYYDGYFEVDVDHALEQVTVRVQEVVS